MFKHFVSTLAALAMLGGAAIAQDPNDLTDKYADVVEDEQTIGEMRAYIDTQTWPSAQLDPAFTAEVGATLPADVELYAFEGVPTAGELRYVVIDDSPVLVDPETRQIVHVYTD